MVKGRLKIRLLKLFGNVVRIEKDRRLRQIMKGREEEDQGKLL